MAKLCYVEGDYRDALGNPYSLWSVFIFVYYLVFLSELRAKGGGGSVKGLYSDCTLHVQCDICW